MKQDSSALLVYLPFGSWVAEISVANPEHYDVDPDLVQIPLLMLMQFMI